MKNILFTLATCGLIGISTGLYSCQKDYFVPFDYSLSDVSYSKDIVPIFDASCNLIGCHSSGFVDPILTVDVAYDNLMNGGYIDIARPDSSLLYVRMIGADGLDPMPLDGTLVGGEAEYVLVWITEGAQDN